jgi:ABC-type molybdenum transport system ATPase subunit/photorepair protein PhrA
VERATVYRDAGVVVGAFDWSLAPGEHWYVRGANGSGKSTLMALVYGDLWPMHGATLERRWPRADEWKRRVGLVSPELQARYAATGCTVREIVTSGLHDSIGLNEFATPAESRRVARELARWGIAGLADRRARELSYGQLRLVLAARVFVRPRRLYLLDEPFDGLDAQARERLRRRLDAVVESDGATLVIASHHEDDVPGYVRRRLTMRRGRAPLADLRAAARPRTRSRRRP